MDNIMKQFVVLKTYKNLTKNQKSNNHRGINELKKTVKNIN